MAAIGGLALIAVVVSAVLLSGGLGGGVPEVTPTMPTLALAALSPVSAILSKAEVLYHDDFDQLSSSKWYCANGTVKASDGLVEITGSADWATNLAREQSLNEGESVLILSKYDADAEFTIQLERGEWKKPDFRRWGIYIDAGYPFETSIWRGESLTGPNLLAGNLIPESDTWYYLLFAVGQDAEFVMRVWERDDPSRQSEYRRMFDESWAGLSWTFGIGANRGKVYVDAFTEMSFNEIQ